MQWQEKYFYTVRTIAAIYRMQKFFPRQLLDFNIREILRKTEERVIGNAGNGGNEFRKHVVLSSGKPEINLFGTFLPIAPLIVGSIN